MSDPKHQSRLTKPGYTIVEMLIIAPIVILMIGAFVTVIVNLTGEVLASRSANVLAYNTQDALNRIEADVRLSTKFLAVNNIALTSPQGYDDATAVFKNVSAGSGNMLVLEESMTVGNPATSTGTAVVRANSPLLCSDPNANSSNTFMTMNVVYFVKNGTLWRRTLASSDYITAGCYTAPVTKPWQQPSCLTGTGGVCLTQDVRILDGITTANFNVQYFNKSSDTVANTIASDPAATDADRNTALQSTTTVGVTLSVTKTAAGRDIGQSGTIRATRVGVTVSTAPTAPTNLTATGGPSQISLTWTAPTNNGGSAITGYKLYRSTTANPTTLVQTLGNVTTYTDTGLVGGTTYYYRVTAINSTGDSPYSIQATATVPVSVTFSYTNTVQTFTVPAGVTVVTVEGWGGQGGPESHDYIGGLGGYAKGSLTVTPGETLNIYVGGLGIKGKAGSTAAFPDGGNGTSGGGGGGSSQVRRGGTALTNRVIVGGGGGGAGDSLVGYGAGYGGIGGYPSGSDGGNNGSTGPSGIPAGGGSQTAGGSGGTTGYVCSGSGGGGTQAKGGLGMNTGSTDGGSGGGGYWGGGGGGFQCGGGGYGGGGGGGSSYIGGVSGASTSNGVRSGNGQIIITY